jgi:hypothetical protein
MVKVRFSSRGTISSWLIRFFTWSKWSHVEFVLPDGRLLGSRFFGGIKIRESLTKFRPCEDIILPTGQNWQSVAMRYVGCGYDYGIFGLPFRLILGDLNRFTCSEYVAVVCKQLFDIYIGESIKIVPRELYLILKNRT